ncbi:MAG: glycosyltransferase family 4 protein [Desulfomicrobium apsheronum]|nr:glycosyltransferase family 4 protein [Desulfomicrobium apsheronum]
MKDGVPRALTVYDRIVFLPFQKDVATVYQDLDAVVMPSRWEAFGLLAAETLASGIPLIGTDCIGLREVLQDTPAIVVPKESPKSLAIAMEKVMLDDLHSIFKAYQDIAAKKYDISNTAQNLKILLQNYV